MLHQVLLSALFAVPALSVPVVKRTDVPAPPGGDNTILNYALTLEYLERKFYMEGLANYTEGQFCGAGFPAPFYQNLQTIASDENTHVDFLKTALGDAAIAEPTFAYPVSDPKAFIGLSSVLEGVGVSAYLGAAPAIASDDYLTAAGSILVVEARHSAYIRNALGEKPFPNPFDTPLGFNQVFSLAAQFIVSFAPGTDLPFKAFPPLTVAPAANGATNYAAGISGITFSNAQKNAVDAGLATNGQTIYAVFYSGLQKYFVSTADSGDDLTATVPGLNFTAAGQPAPQGQVYVLLSTADGKSTQVSDANTISGVGVIEVQ